ALIETEKPEVDHRAHSAEAVELRTHLLDVVPHLLQDVRRGLDRGRNVAGGLHAHQRVRGPADAEPRRFHPREARVRFRGLWYHEWIANLRDRHTVQHRGGVANRFRLDEILAEAVAILVHVRAERHASARWLQADAAAEAGGDANRPGDVGAVRDGHDTGDDGGHAAAC